MNGFLHVFDADGIDKAGLKDAFFAYFIHPRKLQIGERTYYTVYTDDSGDHELYHRHIRKLHNKLMNFCLSHAEIWNYDDENK